MRIVGVRVLAVRAAEQPKAARGVELDELGAQRARARNLRRQALDADVLVEQQMNEQRRLGVAAARRRSSLADDPMRAGIRAQQRQRDERNEDDAEDRGRMLAQQPENGRERGECTEERAVRWPAKTTPARPRACR